MVHTDYTDCVDERFFITKDILMAKLILRSCTGGNQLPTHYPSKPLDGLGQLVMRQRQFVIWTFQCESDVSIFKTSQTETCQIC